MFSTLCWFNPALRSANLAFERRLLICASARTSIAASYAGSLSFRSPLMPCYWKEKGHHLWWPKSLLEVRRALGSKGAAHNPNHRIAIGVFDRGQKWIEELRLVCLRSF
jgi:hypothetical protein